jgi:membrane-associated protein
MCTYSHSVTGMEYWLGQLQELPTAMVSVALAVVMMLDAIPVIGIAIPGDVAILTAMGVSTPRAAAGALLWVVVGCLAGWSLSFVAGRLFGERLRQGRLGAWIGEERWAAAERALGRGGRFLIIAPFLPVLNTLVPLAAGGLRMPYHRFVRYSALGSTLWAGLYVALGLTSQQIGGLLPGQPLTLLATVAIGLTFGWVTLLVARRRITAAEAGAVPAVKVAAGAMPAVEAAGSARETSVDLEAGAPDLVTRTFRLAGAVPSSKRHRAPIDVRPPARPAARRVRCRLGRRAKPCPSATP